MAKKKSRRTAKADPLFGPERVTRQQLLDGVPWPDGVRIGFTVPGEAGPVSTLLKAAADDLEGGHLEALARRECGTWLLEDLAGAALGERLVKARAAGGGGAAARSSAHCWVSPRARSFPGSPGCRAPGGTS
ncbi:hypothetical protein [Streptomyces sp. NPDC051014]|uniref:hypothetical protein n=1 Tax=Streptomyces sp. NPDC051014 TaxID=3155751 RepID=UPI0033F88D3C